MEEISKKQANLIWLISEISSVIERLEHFEEKYSTELSEVHPNFAKSARNLVHYRAMRKEDIRAIQKKLANLGLTQLDRAEAHIMASLLSVRSILEGLLSKKPIKKAKADLTFKKSIRMAKSNAKSLLGYRSKGRRTRIMVTLPSEAAHNYHMVREMISNGMNCARINCAHDTEKEWLLMIGNVRRASEKLNRKCKVTMDLGGPKVRTGTLKPGPKVKKLRPLKNLRGKIVEDYNVWMGPNPDRDPTLPHIPVELMGLKKLKAGDRLFFRDARNKKRELTITSVTKLGCRAICQKTTYLETGMKLYTNIEQNSVPIIVGDLPRLAPYILLHKEDFLRLHRDPVPGEPAVWDDKNKLISQAHISCTLGEVFDQVREGEPVFFDDGRIKGLIRQANKDELLVEIIKVGNNGSKLRADKGINFPESQLKISGLTAKDKKDLEFVVQHADTVNLSYVNRMQDVKDLIAEMQKLGAPEGFGIILKIETQNGFNNLTKILLEAMKNYPLGVMVARGDLAIECGWDNIIRVQREILSLCRAAQIPDIWATQVLENLSKQGIPSRAEMTDAAMAQRTDCVMLNKGPYIIQAIKLLDTIFKDLEIYQEKNIRLSPAMEKADIH
ncbi:MAG: hypothetical protein HKO75_00805 [Flavobacteriaceae bacterium]|nr:hypothetical protein [Muriicola sp.]NNK20769.1 hypothetical protein [Flavobacteriaceae bacterium]NNL38375.1 hypothetical protein [Flavobacteriaceae bacterium]